MELAEIKRRKADGRLYIAYSDELFAEQMARRDVLDEYNSLPFSHMAERDALLRRLVAEAGEGCMIEPPLHANWSGANLHLGNRVYANMGLTLVDDTDIFIEDDVMIGPNVTICTGTHPVSPRLRALGLQYNKPVRIESAPFPLTHGVPFRHDAANGERGHGTGHPSPKYSAEFKQRAVGPYRERGGTCAEIARELGVDAGGISDWVERADAAQAPPGDDPFKVAEENRRPRRGGSSGSGARTRRF